MVFPSLMRRRAPALLLLAAVTGLAVTASLAAPQVAAENKFETLKTLQSERRGFAAAISPAVVAIAATKPDLGQAAQTGMAGATAMAAAGFVVDGDYVITCIEASQMYVDESDPRARKDPARRNTLLQNDETVWIMAHDGTEFGGKVIGRDMRNLLLLVKMDEGHPSLPSLKLGDSDKVPMGSAVCGFGNSLDSLVLDRQISMSYGTASGFYRFEPVDVMQPDKADTGGDPYKGNVLEVDVAVHSGDHGGPILNMNGEVVGMLNAHFMAGRHLGCAVPSNQIRAVLPQLKKGVPEGELAQGDFGFGVGYPKGSNVITIKQVDAEGPAARAGITVGWRLVRVDNYRVPNGERLAEMLGRGHITRKRGGGLFQRESEVPVSYGVPPGTHIQLTLRNPEDGSEKTIDLIVGEKAEDF